MTTSATPPARPDDPHDDGIFPVAAYARWGKASASAEEEVFLEGPSRRRNELMRAVRIFFEFIKGFRQLHFVGPCVTVFGSARFDETTATTRWRARWGGGSRRRASRS